MSRNINVNPGHYKVAGRERQGEAILQSSQKGAYAQQLKEVRRGAMEAQAGLPAWETTPPNLEIPDRETARKARTRKTQARKTRKKARTATRSLRKKTAARKPTRKTAPGRKAASKRKAAPQRAPARATRRRAS